MQERKVPSNLLTGEKNKEHFLVKWNGCKEITDKIIKIFDRKVYNNRTKEEDFEVPNWPCKRAFQDGYNKAVEDFKKYLP